MMRNKEERQLRAVAALDALECLLDMVPPDEMLDARRLSALLSVTNDAVRDALPKGAALLGVND